MEKPSLEKFNEEGLVLDKDRVLTYSKLVCPLGCEYCFTEDLNSVQEKGVVYLSERQYELLANLPEEIKTIMLGCDTEFFQDKDEAIDILKNFQVWEKIFR